MSIIYEWDTSNVAVYPTKTDANDVAKTDVIWRVNWKLIAIDTENNNAIGNTVSSIHSAGVALDISDFEDFIEFDSVTSSDVLGWVEDASGEDEIEKIKAILDNDIDLQLYPTTINRRIGE